MCLNPKRHFTPDVLGTTVHRAPDCRNQPLTWITRRFLPRRSPRLRRGRIWESSPGMSVWCHGRGPGPTKRALRSKVSHGGVFLNVPPSQSGPGVRTRGPYVTERTSITPNRVSPSLAWRPGPPLYGPIRYGVFRSLGPGFRRWEPCLPSEPWQGGLESLIFRTVR